MLYFPGDSVNQLILFLILQTLQGTSQLSIDCTSCSHTHTSGLKGRLFSKLMNLLYEFQSQMNLPYSNCLPTGPMAKEKR